MGNGNCKKCNKCKCDNCDMGDKNLTNNLIDKKLEIIKNDSYESFESEINKDNPEENNENKVVQVSKNIENEKNTTNNNQEIITDNKKDKEKLEIDNSNSINVNEKNDTINNINIIYNDKDKDKDKDIENKKEENYENNINNNSNNNNEKENMNEKQLKKKKKNDILENINKNFESYKKLDFDVNEDEKENMEEKNKIIKTRNNLEEFEIINNDLVYISNKNKNIEDNIDIEYNVDTHLKANCDNTIDTKENKEENKNIVNANKCINIYNIIPKNKILNLDDNAIVCNGILEKIIKIPSKNKIVYNERFCVLTKKTFSYYKSKESYLNLNKPLLLIDLKNIKKVEQTILDDTSYYFGLICNINDDTKMFIDKINTFINIGENNTEEFLLGFRSKNKDLIIKWIVILNYLVENNQIKNQ